VADGIGRLRVRFRRIGARVVLGLSQGCCPIVAAPAHNQQAKSHSQPTPTHPPTHLHRAVTPHDDEGPRVAPIGARHDRVDALWHVLVEQVPAIVGVGVG